MVFDFQLINDLKPLKKAGESCRHCEGKRTGIDKDGYDRETDLQLLYFMKVNLVRMALMSALKLGSLLETKYNQISHSRKRKE